jgi:hypothetical protein
MHPVVYDDDPAALKHVAGTNGNTIIFISFVCLFVWSFFLLF